MVKRKVTKLAKKRSAAKKTGRRRSKRKVADKKTPPLLDTLLKGRTRRASDVFDEADEGVIHKSRPTVGRKRKGARGLLLKGQKVFVPWGADWRSAGILKPMEYHGHKGFLVEIHFGSLTYNVFRSRIDIRMTAPKRAKSRKRS